MNESRKRVLDFARSYVRKNHRGPTIREIQGHLGYASPNAARLQVNALTQGGLLRADQRGSRGAIPVRLNDGIPVFGTIPAGIPIDAQTSEDESIDIDSVVFGIKDGGQAFELRVRGHSMIGAGIHDGDLVILVARPACDGDVVAALVDQKSTLKRYLCRGGRAYLKAENPVCQDIYPADELLIQGVMVGLIRRGF